MKNILVPTDFSDNAYNALKYAVQLYAADDCTFYLLHTYTPAIYQSEYLLHSPSQLGPGDTYHTESIAHLKRLKERVIAEFKNTKHNFKTHSAFSTLTDEILETVEKERIDLIIMGTKGAVGAAEILLGTNTVHVIKRTQCPVIVVPSNYVFQAPREILFPTDYEVEYQKVFLTELLHIAKRHKGKMNVLHVSTGYNLNEEQLTNKMHLTNMFTGIDHHYHAVPDTEIITAINDFQANKKIHFLAMVKNKHTFFERLFREPVIKKIGFHVNIPFMVFPFRSN